MASVIDCFIAKGQRQACKDGEEGGGWRWMRGARCRHWGCAEVGG